MQWRFLNMGRYRKILVAIDGSESSKHALRESFKLASDEKCWITVVSVIPSYEGDLGAMWINNVKEAMAKPCELALSEAENIAKKERVLIKTVCEEGEIYERIVDLADAENSDLIVMGRKGTAGLQRTLVGSVTARVIGHSQRDVLVVPNDTSIGWKSILFATDGSKFSEAATDKAIDFAKSYGSELNVITVVDVTEEFMARAPGALEDLVKKAKSMVEDVKKKADSKGIKAESIVREGDAYKVIINVAKKQKANAIIMGSHGRTGLKRLLMGSVTERVIGHAPCPVLIVKA
jgi:nucleotide-binding universal stress UspA family protein